MKKVAIVGVEQSGKTVLMAAMGDKYRKPGEDGLFLYANSRKTIEYCNEQINKLRNQHKWPDSTPPDSLVNLEWTLMRRKKGGKPEELCSVAFLDFAGEIYRYAFADSEDDADKRNSYRNQIEAIKSHLRDAESVMVLVNLSDIINSRGVSKKASEMDWLSQRIFDFIFSEASEKRVAIVFTQKDLYNETIVECGGLQGVFEEYMPSVFYRHESQILPFSVSAVNKTVPGDDGEQMPASDFDSEGLDELLDWMTDRIWTPEDDFMEQYRLGRYDRLRELVSNFDLESFAVKYVRTDCKYAIATMYEHGWGVGKNYSKATNLYQEVINQIDSGRSDKKYAKFRSLAADAIKRITQTVDLQDGGETKQKSENCGSYIDALLDAAVNGDCKAQFRLGYAYLYGRGVTEDKTEAVKWYRKSAEQGDPDAQNSLGYAYSYGEGVAQDKAEAVVWYRKAAEQGLASAQNSLGYAYDHGVGVAEDKDEAEKWYRKAAEQGYAAAQTNLGYMRKGMAEDTPDAVEIYKRADENSKTGCLMRILNIVYMMLFVAVIVVILYLSFKE